MANPTSQMEWLLEAYHRDYTRPVPKDVEKIKLSQMVSKLGFVYEKFRVAVDYNEEHLIRRNSLERFLRRQILFLMEKRAPKISKTLIYEFIRARYLPNETLPETLIEEVAQTIDKYLIIIGQVIATIPAPQKINDWIVSMAACEIDEQLFPHEKETAIINFMYSKMVDDLAFVNVKIEEKEKNLQIYIAVLKTLVKADANTLRYRLLNLYLPNWKKLSEEERREFGKNVLLIKSKIDKNMNHPLAFQLAHAVRVQSVFFRILREVIETEKENLRPVFSDPDSLEEKIESICMKNYKKIRNRLIGSIFRVIIYILLTKTVLAFILEYPYDKYIIGEIHWDPLIINIVFHPLLMFLVAATIRVPGAKNTKLIVEQIKKIVYGEERKIVFKPKQVMKRGSASYVIFNTFYLIMFIISFGIILTILRKLDFNIVSGFLFIFFLTTVSFFGFRLRTHAKELSVIPRKDTFLSFLADFLSLPIVRVGRFVSTNFSKVNIFLYLLDFIIETPFKMLVEFLEKIVSFIREKREEIVE